MAADSSLLPELESTTGVTLVTGPPSQEGSPAKTPRRGPVRDTLATRISQQWPVVRGYDVLSIIGFGGMGVVYKALHRDLRRTVALKMLRGSALADPEYRERFSAEAQAVARLQHPNIIQVFEIGKIDWRSGDVDQSPFIALEFVDGGSLTRLTDRPQPPNAAAELVEKLARAVHSAHQVGVIHRDLKPANVLMTIDGEPKIADFGLAKQVGGERDEGDRYVTQIGMVMGTPEYMAPEQSLGNPPVPAFDIYALGVILYELLTGRVPFQAATPTETMILARTQEPVSPRRLQPTVPRDLETICLKCLEKEPVRRYATAQELADDLQRFRKGRTIQARRANTVERLERWCRRNPLVAGLLTSVVAIVLAAFVLVSRSYWLAENARQEEAWHRAESERKEKAERWERYRANIVAAASALQVHDVVAAGRLLDAVPEEYRNWEWRHFNSRLDSAGIVLNCPGGLSDHTHLAADGKWALQMSPDRRIHLWNIAKRCVVRTYPSDSKLDGGCMTPDGKKFAYIAADRSVVVSDVDLQQTSRLSPLVGDCEIWLRINDDGTLLTAVGADRTIHAWSIETEKLVSDVRIDRPDVATIDISPDARRICYKISGANKSRNLFIRDLETGKEIELPPHQRDLHFVKFSPTGDRLLTVEDYRSNLIRVWNPVTGRLLGELSGHTNSITDHAFSPAGDRFATCSRDQTIRIWNPSNWKLIGVLRGHRGAVQRIAFSPDGKRIASASEDQTVRIWDAESGQEVAVLHGHTGPVVSVAYGRNGEEIVSASVDGTIRVWDAHAVETDGIMRGHSSFVYGVAFHPDGKLLASAGWDGAVRIWDAGSGRQVSSLDHGYEMVVSSVAFDPSGRLLASRARDAVRIWDVASKKEIYRWDVSVDSFHDSRVTFNAAGDLVAAGCDHHEIRIWNVKSGQEVAVLKGHDAPVRDVAFSPDGKWLASAGDGGDKSVRIWDLSTQATVQVLEGHSDCVYAVKFSGDGRLVASASVDGTVRLWDTTDWHHVALLKHGPKVYDVAFSKDNSRLACACADNSIRFWDTTTYQEVAALRGHGNYVHAVAFSPDGTRLASASGDATVRIWETVRPQDRRSITRYAE